MYKGHKRGFTLIELLVVIAIIGILAAIVLVSLGNVRQRGANTGIGANLAGLRTAAELYNQANTNSYDGFCANTGANGGDRALDAARAASGIAAISIDATGASGQATCNDGASGWAAEVPLATPTTGFWCVDYNGYSGSTTASTLASATDYTCN